MRLLLVAVVVLLDISSAKIFEKCELATILATKHGMSPEEVKNWVCIAQYESTFNTAAINHANWDGSKDYGLFQLNNKYWCGDESGKNECRMPCTDLLDDDLTDDLACIRKILKDTERWKGKGTGLTAWVAYVNRCQNRNLDKYIAECSIDASSISNVINTKDETPQKTEAITENEDVIGVSAGGSSPITNLVRVPIMYKVMPYIIPHAQPILINPNGYIHQQVYQ